MCYAKIERDMVIFYKYFLYIKLCIELFYLNYRLSKIDFTINETSLLVLLIMYVHFFSIITQHYHRSLLLAIESI